MPWQEKVAGKQQEQLNRIPQEWQLPQSVREQFSATSGHRLIDESFIEKSGLLTEDELAITQDWSAKDLRDHLASGQLTALAVTTAFCKRAALAQQATKCLTEIFFNETLERAQLLDQYFKEHGKPMGPLHGLPISIKESFSVKGQYSTSGWVSWIDHDVETENSAVVDVLLKLGAVLYCKTNIPQSYMTADSENNVFGRTLNPHNTSLTAGGSSGGEGALVALRGSLLGIGTDIAGSIRIPALCCGVHGFKPTSDRFPHGGQKFGDDEIQGLPSIRACSGPLAHSLSDIEFLMDVVLGASPENYDSTAHAVPWRKSHDHQVQEPLTIGIIAEDPDYPLHPPVQRTLDRAVEALKRAGQKIVHLRPDDAQISLAARLGTQYFATGPSGGGEDHYSGVDAEPKVRSVANGANPFWNAPPPVDTRLNAFYKYSELHKIRRRLEDDWRKMWVDKQLDCVVGPGAQNTAVAHDTYGWVPYTLLYNVLDYPACIIPFGRASKEDDPTPMSVPGPYQPSYNPEEVDGAPCAIQVATRRFQDEKCIQVAKIIDEVLKNSQSRR